MQQTGRLVHAKTDSTDLSFYPSTLSVIVTPKVKYLIYSVSKVAEKGWGLLNLEMIKLSTAPWIEFLFCVFTSLSRSSPVHEQPSLGHLIAIDKIFLPVALSGNTSYSSIRKKIKGSAQD